MTIMRDKTLPHVMSALWLETSEGGLITEWGKQVYSEGDCWALAWFLYHEFQARDVNVTMMFAGDNLKRWYHVFVRLDDTDTYFDVNGEQTEKTMMRVWPWKFHEAPGATLASWDAFHDTFGDWCYNRDAVVAEAMAVNLIDEWEWN